MSARRINPIETIHLSARDKRRLVSEINQNSKTVPAQMDRRSLRVEFNVGQLVVTITHPNRHVAAYSVAPRNLSRRGIAFIHGQFIYVDSPCTVMMPTRDGKWVNVTGKVVGCRHLSGLLHEVSVAFKEDIDLTAFIDLTAEQQQRIDLEISRRLTPTDARTPSDAVRQAMLVIDDMAVRRLVKLWLHQLGFEAAEVEPQDVERWTHERGFDLVVIDMLADVGKGDRLIRKLTAAGFKGHIMAVSADGHDRQRGEAMKAGAEAFLEMPFTHLALQEAIDALAKKPPHAAEAQPEALYPSMTVDPLMRPLLEEFVGTLNDSASQLGEALKGHDQAGMLRLCRRLKGSGGGYGFEPISESAKLALLALEAEQHNLSDIKDRVNELIALLQRARAS